MEHFVETRGFVFAATGEKYVTLARRAAHTLRLATPDAQIDIFTDQDVSDTVFNQVHQLEISSRRPKLEVLRRSRFDKTIMLDADVVCLMDFSELFDLLEHAHLGAVHDVIRRRDHLFPHPGIPRAHPVFNTGLLLFRKSHEVQSFARKWSESMERSQSLIDQPSFRRLVWTTQIPFVSIPREYNVIQLLELYSWGGSMGAPRVLHVQDLHRRDPGDADQPFNLDAILPKKMAEHLRLLIEHDPTLTKKGSKPAPRLINAHGLLN